MDWRDDIERYLHDETVEACPPSAAYRLRKFARRNRRALATGAIVIAALLAGTVVSTWQAIRATRATACGTPRRSQASEGGKGKRTSGNRKRNEKRRRQQVGPIVLPRCPLGCRWHDRTPQRFKTASDSRDHCDSENSFSRICSISTSKWSRDECVDAAVGQDELAHVLRDGR